MIDRNTLINAIVRCINATNSDIICLEPDCLYKDEFNILIYDTVEGYMRFGHERINLVSFSHLPDMLVNYKDPDLLNKLQQCIITMKT